MAPAKGPAGCYGKKPISTEKCAPPAVNELGAANVTEREGILPPSLLPPLQIPPGSGSIEGQAPPPKFNVAAARTNVGHKREASSASAATLADSYFANVKFSPGVTCPSFAQVFIIKPSLKPSSLNDTNIPNSLASAAQAYNHPDIYCPTEADLKAGLQLFQIPSAINPNALNITTTDQSKVTTLKPTNMNCMVYEDPRTHKFAAKCGPNSPIDTRDIPIPPTDQSKIITTTKPTKMNCMVYEDPRTHKFAAKCGPNDNPIGTRDIQAEASQLPVPGGKGLKPPPMNCLVYEDPHTHKFGAHCVPELSQTPGLTKRSGSVEDTNVEPLTKLINPPGSGASDTYKCRPIGNSGEQSCKWILSVPPSFNVTDTHPLAKRSDSTSNNQRLCLGTTPNTWSACTSEARTNTCALSMAIPLAVLGVALVLLVVNAFLGRRKEIGREGGYGTRDVVREENEKVVDEKEWVGGQGLKYGW